MTVISITGSCVRVFDSIRRGRRRGLCPADTQAFRYAVARGGVIGMFRGRLPTVMIVGVCAASLTACASESEAYSLGKQAGESYAALADLNDTANSWGADLGDLGAATRKSVQQICTVEWQTQGIRLQVKKTPENERDFMRGCQDAISHIQ